MNPHLLKIKSSAKVWKHSCIGVYAESSGAFLCLPQRLRSLPPLTEPAAHSRIPVDMLTAVRLLLKGNVAVGVALHEQSHEPLEQIADIKPYIQQFLHLGGMYRFVVLHRLRQRACAPSGEHDTEKIHRSEPLERDDIIVNDYHKNLYIVLWRRNGK